MARISFETSQATSSTNTSGVGFFNLKNNGDEAIVRIMHDSVNDFDILTTHNVNIGGKYRKVSCLRDPRDPIDNCPLCAAGQSIAQRFFIHMVQYDNVDGQIVPKAVVWERTANEYGKKLKSMIDEYGPLSDCIFKVKRNGAAGYMKTTYEIMFCNPNVYRADLYPKMPELFENYNVLGNVVLDKSAEDINIFLTTGSFPQPNNNEVMNQSANNYAAPETYVPKNNGFSDNLINAVEDNAPAQAPRSTLPWETPQNQSNYNPAFTTNNYAASPVPNNGPVNYSSNPASPNQSAINRPQRSY